MSPMLQVLLVAVGTYLTRVSMVIALGRVTLPPSVEHGLRLIAPAVLSALVVQLLLLDDGKIREWSIWYPAAGIAALVAWRTKSTAWTLLVGFVAVWVLAAMF